MEEKKVLKTVFFRCSKSLKSKILATMVPPQGYHYKPPVLSYSEVGTYDSQDNREKEGVSFIALFHSYPLTKIKIIM